MLTKDKKHKKPTSIRKPLTQETAEILKNTMLANLTEEEGILLNRALNSALARSKALTALKENQLFF